MTREEAIELAMKACEETWNEKTCKQIRDALEQEPSGEVEILKTEESNDNGTKYLNINVSDAEVKRNPDIVRLCSDVGMLEYAKPKTGNWIKSNIPNEKYVCSECGGASWYYDCQGDVAKSKYCPNCGAKMVEPQENCDTCKHKDDEWDSEHCDGCCGNHSGFEPQERSDKE